MPVKIGALDLKKAYVGTTPIKALYAGSTKIWSSGFDPKSIPDLSVWVDANDPGNLSIAWQDLSGLGHHGTIVGSPPPVVKPATLNGMPVVRFTANEGRVRGAGKIPTTTTPLTVVYVTRMVGPNVGRVFTDPYPPHNFLVGAHTSGEPQMYDNGWVGNNYGYGALPGPWRMYGAVCTWTPRLSSFYLDGVFRASHDLSTGHDTGWNLSGYDAAGVQETCDCEVAELLVYARALPDAERQQVEGYLRTKWGLA